MLYKHRLPLPAATYGTYVVCLCRHLTLPSAGSLEPLQSQGGQLISSECSHLPAAILNLNGPWLLIIWPLGHYLCLSPPYFTLLIRVIYAFLIQSFPCLFCSLFGFSISIAFCVIFILMRLRL